MKKTIAILFSSVFALASFGQMDYLEFAGVDRFLIPGHRVLTLADIFGAALWQGEFVPTAEDYVQDGLIVMWDAIENAGYGVHDTTAILWKDLVGSNDLAVDLAVATWGADRLTVKGDTLEGTAANPIHAEFVWRDYAKSTTGNYISIGNNKGIAAFWYQHAVAGGKYSFSSNTSGAQNKNAWSSRSFCYSPKQYWRNGVRYTSLYNVDVTSYGKLSGMHAHATSASNPMYVGCIRLYNRQLTPEEIAWNYSIDKIRFNLP